MPTCKECEAFFAIEDQPDRGDCVHQEVDSRQTYYTLREVEAEADASQCSRFQQKATST